MALEDFKSEPKRVGDKDKFQKPELCPCCGKEGEHVRGNEYKCTTDRDQCETISWFHTDFDIDHATMR